MIVTSETNQANQYSSISLIIMAKLENFLDFKSKIGECRYSWLKQEMEVIQNRVAESCGIYMVSKGNGQSKFIAGNHQSQGPTCKLENLKQEKEKLREKLREVIEKERIMKNSSTSPASSLRAPLLITDASLENRNRNLKRIARKYNNFKNKLVEKSRQIQVEEQLAKLRVRKLQEEKMKTQCDQRRAEIVIKLAKIEERAEKRRNDFENEKKLLRKLKKKKLFERMTENFHSKMNEMEVDKMNSYEELKKMKSVDLSTLKEHEQTYEMVKVEREEKRTLRLEESRFLPEASAYKSRYYESILKQERERKREIEERAEKAKKIIEKHKQYQEKVLQEHAPEQKQAQPKDEHESPKNYTLERKQLLKLGNEYFHLGQARTISSQLQQQMKAQQQYSKIVAVPTNSNKYPNYLPQILKGVDASAHRHRSQHLKKINKILANSKLSEAEKMEEVRSFVQFAPQEKLEESQLMLARMRLKMDALKMMR